MARKPIPETTDAETELADIRQLNTECLEALRIWTESKLDTKLKREAYEELANQLHARIAEPELPLLAVGEAE